MGVGKSHLLYLLAAEYRLNRKLFRVTYINDCSQWKKNPYDYLMQELVTTFYNDTIGDKSISEYCEAVVGSDKEEKMMMIMMTSLINYVRTSKLQWLVVCDQHNALFNPPKKVNDFPFNIIYFLADNRSSNIKIVISASANNEGYPTEMNGWYTHDISSHRFDDDEFATWCTQYPLEDCKKVNPLDGDAIDALYWTGNFKF